TVLATSETVTVVTGLTIDDVSVLEGNSAFTNMVFTVRLSPVNPSQTVTVHYETADGTASGSPGPVCGDYCAQSGTLTFNPNVSKQTITISVVGDLIDENTKEIFFVELTNPVNASIGDSEGIGTIVDD